MIHPMYTYNDWSVFYKLEMAAFETMRTTRKYHFRFIPFKWAIRKEWEDAKQAYVDAVDKTCTALNYLMWIEKANSRL